MSPATKPELQVGLVGATGAVGEVFLQLLSERRFPVKKIKLFASDRSVGQTKQFNGQTYTLEALSADGFKGLDLVFFAVSDDIARDWAPRAVEAGALVIDNSSFFRMDSSKLLVVPEVNGHLLPKPGTPQLIANPNCSTIQLVVALAPLLKDFGIESVHVATYQAVSGAGLAGQEELGKQTKSWAANETPPTPQVFPHPIAMNCIPQIGSFMADGFCTEEQKIMRETRKILGNSELRISAFTVRVPAWNSHSEAVWVRLKKTATREQVIASLRRQSGLIVEEGTSSGQYPTALAYSDKNPVGVGRIHQDLDDPQTWLMWIVADNLRKGAALNGLQIAERIFDITPAS